MDTLIFFFKTQVQQSNADTLVLKGRDEGKHTFPDFCGPHFTYSHPPPAAVTGLQVLLISHVLGAARHAGHSSEARGDGWEYEEA